MVGATCCFSALTECKFLLSIIQSFVSIIQQRSTKFIAPIEFKQEAKLGAEISMNDLGLVAIVYYQAFQQVMPYENPTPMQINMINAVRTALGFPLI